jgi:hypothetical protein
MDRDVNKRKRKKKKDNKKKRKLEPLSARIIKEIESYTDLVG